MSEAKAPAAREAAVYYDSRQRPHPALVTERWSDTCINVAFLSLNEGAVDPHGRQLDRQTSQVHASFNDMKACCWDVIEEDMVLEDLVIFTDDEGDDRHALITKRLDDGSVNLAMCRKGDKVDVKPGGYTEESDYDCYGWKIERKLKVGKDKIRQR